MKDEERTAKAFLSARFSKTPAFEPLGTNLPPDFSIGDTAFEVRRLNQRYLADDGSNAGLEKVDIGLNLALHREFSKIPFSETSGTFFWGSRYRRPLAQPIHRIVKEIADQVRRYYVTGSRQPKEIASYGLTIDLIASETTTTDAFCPGYRSDENSGGCLGDIYSVGIKFALKEKIAKTAKIATRFRRWVLVLVDDILSGIVEPGDIPAIELSFDHFDSISVIDWFGNLVWECPPRSLKLHQQISERAYAIYEERGRGHGHDLDDWLKAERE